VRHILFYGLIIFSIIGCKENQKFSSGSSMLTKKEEFAKERLILTSQPEMLAIQAGEQAQFTAFIERPNGARENITDKVVWTISPPNVAEPAPGFFGLYSGKATGDATVTVQLEDIFATSKLIVSQIPKVDFDLDLTPKNHNTGIGMDVSYTLVANYKDGNSINVTDKAQWSVEKVNIAALSPTVKGSVKTLAVGNTQLIAAFNNKTAQTNLTVEADPIKQIDIKSQVGKKVRVCIAYDKVKIPGHQCDRALFDVHFFDLKVGQVNLNNKSSGGSVEGGKFNSAWDKDGSFKIQTKCATPTSCHRDVAFLSVIGDVTDVNGQNKWLKIEQGKIKPDTPYVYKFTDFSLSDKPLEFGPLCTFVQK
jgi:hypothetical protein